MPVRLRANVVANPVVDRVNFKLWSQAVFPVNGCGDCMDAREKTLREAGISSAVVQTAVPLCHDCAVGRGRIRGDRA